MPSDAFRPVALIVNPVAGRRLTALLYRLLPQLLRRRHLEPRVYHTEGPGHATQLARRLSSQVGLVVAVGGDGTVSEVARGLAETGCPLAVIPAGTANMLATELGVPPEPNWAVRELLAGEVREMDLFRANGRLGVAVVGVGIDAAVTRWMARSRSGHIGYLSYLAGIWREFGRYHRPLVELTVGRSTASGLYQVVVTNTRLYAGLFRLAPQALLDDGLIEVTAFAGPEHYRPYKHFAAIVSGRHRRLRDVCCRQANRVEVRGPGDVPYQVDGDFAGTGPVTIEVVPRALRVLVPRTPIYLGRLSRRGGPWRHRDTCESAPASTPSGPCP